MLIHTSGLQPHKRQGCRVSQPWRYCTGPSILMKSCTLLCSCWWHRARTPGIELVLWLSPCPLMSRAPTRSRKPVLDAAQVCLHFSGLQWLKLPWVTAAQHVLQQQLCAMLLPRSVCFVSWTDGPSCVKRQHRDFVMCPFLFNLVPIMQNARHVWCHLTLRPMQYMFAGPQNFWDWAASDLPSTYLTAIALCSLFLSLPIWIFCYQSPAADIFLIIPSLQSIFCKQLVNSLWDLESLC